MGVISFGSLKGGVGKTSLSVNVAHGFAERGCETLLIDLDPMGHASRFFADAYPSVSNFSEAPLAKLFLGEDLDKQQAPVESLVEEAIDSCVSLIRPVRDRMALLPAGHELKHFLWGRGARAFRALFPKLIHELRSSYDYIVIDTAPDFNVLMRNAIAVADLVVIPVDSSSMSIHCLEEIVTSAAHIKGPTWMIARTMVNKQALRVQRLSASRLGAHLAIKNADDAFGDDDDDGEVPDITNPEVFISLLEERRNKKEEIEGLDSTGQHGSPIYLLNNLVYRSEEQNRLSFLGRTAFDQGSSTTLREQYLSVVRELEQMITFRASADPMLRGDDIPALGVAAAQG